MIRPASEVAASQNMYHFDKACEDVMRVNENAASIGKRSCLFDPRPTELYSVVKAEFRKNGYRFEPIGVLGGVRQDGEYICW